MRVQLVEVAPVCTAPSFGFVEYADGTGGFAVDPAAPVYTDEMRQLGVELRAARRMADVSLTQAAEQFGFTVVQLSQLECGKRWGFASEADREAVFAWYSAKRGPLTEFERCE